MMSMMTSSVSLLNFVAYLSSSFYLLLEDGGLMVFAYDLDDVAACRHPQFREEIADEAYVAVVDPVECLGVCLVDYDCSFVHMLLLAYPTLPSRVIWRSFCASTANSIGSLFITSLAYPLTINATASSKGIPRCWQ